VRIRLLVDSLASSLLQALMARERARAEFDDFEKKEEEVRIDWIQRLGSLYITFPSMDVYGLCICGPQRGSISLLGQAETGRAFAVQILTTVSSREVSLPLQTLFHSPCRTRAPASQKPAAFMIARTVSMSLTFI
jgi:hypothetical protein